MRFETSWFASEDSYYFGNPAQSAASQERDSAVGNAELVDEYAFIESVAFKTWSW